MTMPTRRIGLIGYASRHFLRFASELESSGFTVYWINKQRSDSAWLLDNGVSKNYVFDGYGIAEQADIAALRDLETEGAPRINDIILMDRVLRRVPYGLALRYLTKASETIERAITDNKIELVSTWRDTAFQLIAMLVCKKVGVPFVVPFRIRIPKDRFAFSRSYSSADIIPTRQTTALDLKSALEFTSEFRSRGIKPYLKISSGKFSEVVKLIPKHSRAFATALRDARFDYGNRCTRASIGDVLTAYLIRRWRLLAFSLVPPFKQVRTRSRPYFLYALHTQPESSIDVEGSFYSNQVVLVEQIARATPITHDLYVKIHPSDVDGRPLSFYKALRRIPSVILIGPMEDSRRLIKEAALVLTVTGTIAYEAGLLGVPAVTFANNFFNRIPGILYCPDPRKLSEFLVSAEPESVGADAATATAVADIFAASYPGEVNRVGGFLSEAEYRVLGNAYLDVWRVLVGSTDTNAAN